MANHHNRSAYPAVVAQKLALKRDIPVNNPSRSHSPNFLDLKKDGQLLLAFGLGAGLSPKAPGTVGTIAALPGVLLLGQFALFGQLLILTVVVALGVLVSDYAVKKLRVHDHPGIVIDEFAGLWLSFFLVPLSLPLVVIGFILFRLLDILKPWPISWLDRKVKGGIGVMADDLLAGLITCLILHGLIRVPALSAWLV